jgi:hypothetical protein
MDSPSFIIAGDIEIPEGVTQVNLITPLSRYDFVTLDLSEDEDTLLVRRVSPDELATFTGVLFQADSHEESGGIVLRQLSLLFWPFDDDEADETDDDDDDGEPKPEEDGSRGFRVVSADWWNDYLRKQSGE